MAEPSIIAINEPIAGTAFITVDGVTHLLDAECSYSVAKVSKSTKSGMSGVYGRIETPRACFIAGTFVDRGGLRVEDFADMDDVTVRLELISGKVIVLAGAHTTDAAEVNAATGSFQARWESGNGRELLATG